MQAMAFLLWLLLGSQEPTDSLLQRMTHGRIDERESAAAELVRRGREVVPALEAAARSADPDHAARARMCLEKLAFAERLTPGLREVIGLPERLRRGGTREWSAVLAEAVPERCVRTYEALTEADLACLAVEVLKTSVDDKAVTEAVQIIATHRLEAARPEVERIASRREPQLRAAGAKALIRMAGPRGLDAAEPFLADKDALVRSAAVAAIGEERLPGGGALLATMTSDPGVSDELGRAFWRLRAREGISFLSRSFNRQSPPGNMHAMYLSFYAGPEELPLFRGLLKWLEQDPNSAESGLRMVGDWGDRDSIPVIEKAVASFKLWGNCPSMAAEALVKMGATSSSKTLLTLARQNRNERAIWALGAMGFHEAIPDIREFLDPPLYSAILALADLDDREAAPLLRPLLGHKDRHIRGAACTALAVFQDEASIPTIKQLRREADHARRIWPVLGPPKAEPEVPEVEVLLRRLKDINFISERWTTSKHLLAKGRREGMKYFLEEEHYPFALNAVRNPERWKEFQQKTVPVRLYAPIQRLHEKLAEIAGMKLEGPPVGNPILKAWTDVHGSIGRRGPPPTLVEAYEFLEDRRWSVVLDEDKIRILPWEQAREFWKRWAAGLEK